jgi:hypothetical protein
MDWPVFFGAFGGFVVIAGGVAVQIIIALKTGKKVEQAATRREELAAGAEPSPTARKP